MFLTCMVNIYRKLSLLNNVCLYEQSAPIKLGLAILLQDLRCFCLLFLVKVMRFNRARAAADVSQEELSHTYSITNASTETGFRYTSFTRSHEGLSSTSLGFKRSLSEDVR